MDVDQPDIHSNAHNTNEHEHQADTQAHLTELQTQFEQYHNWIVQYVRNAAGLTEGQEPYPPSDGLDVPGLVVSIYGATSAHSYLTALKSWAESVRNLERKQRDLSPSTIASTAKAAGFAAPSHQPSVLTDQEAYTAAAHEVIAALGAAFYAGEVASYYAQAGIHAVPELYAVSEAISARMHTCR